MPVRWAVASSNWSDVNTWNSGSVLGIPTGSDEVWTNSYSVNIDQSFEVVGLRNNARARDIATPAMTANNAPSPYIAAASSVSVGRDAWTAFDRSTVAGTGWLTANLAVTGWLSMDFGSGSATIIDGYTIFGTNLVSQNPRNWSLQGSSDNTSWTDLHIVSGAAAIPANGSYSIASIGNSTGYRYYRVNITLNGGNVNTLGIAELELYQPGTIALAAGGSFIFNSGSISGSATSTTAALTAGATNLIQVTAATGSVTLNLGSAVTGLGTATTQIFNHTGNSNFNLNGVRFTGGSTTNAFCINKSSTGTITITGDLVGAAGNNAHGLFSTAGNTVVMGSVFGGGSGVGIGQSAGNITLTGNVTGGTGTNVVGISLTGASSQFTIIGNVTGGTGTSAHGITFTGTSGSVTGTVTGGAGNGINSSGQLTITGNVVGGTSLVGVNNSNNTTIIGNITGATVAGLGSTVNNTTTVTGTVTASTTALGINSTSTGTVLLTGNMLNVAGKQAIFAQNLFISDTATTQWRLFTPGGQDKTLYSADTFPNQPSSANVRSGSLFGPSNVLSGSMVVPSPSDVRVNVLTDNTVGTGQSLTAADFLAAISASADPYAQRLRNVATVDTVGSLLTGFNNGGF